MDDVLEFNICIKDVDNKYVDNLIISLVRCGYQVYLSYEEDNICFTGHADEVISQKVKKV